FQIEKISPFLLLSSNPYSLWRGQKTPIPSHMNTVVMKKQFKAARETSAMVLYGEEQEGDCLLPISASLGKPQKCVSGTKE
ncbi:hypothetical protein S245_005785, partial [Arachis hypogaea]